MIYGRPPISEIGNYRVRGAHDLFSFRPLPRMFNSRRVTRSLHRCAGIAKIAAKRNGTIPYGTELFRGTLVFDSGQWTRRTNETIVASEFGDLLRCARMFPPIIERRVYEYWISKIFQISNSRYTYSDRTINALY